MNMKYYNLLAILVFFGMIACSGEKKGDSAKEETVETVLPDETNEVTVMTLKTTDFNHELVSNGPPSCRPAVRIGRTDRFHLCEERRPGDERAKAGGTIHLPAEK